jgi:hypothetical protein
MESPRLGELVTGHATTIASKPKKRKGRSMSEVEIAVPPDQRWYGAVVCVHCSNVTLLDEPTRYSASCPKCDKRHHLVVGGRPHVCACGCLLTLKLTMDCESLSDREG